MQVLVLYFSKGGNTAKLADSIAQGVKAGGAEAVVKTTAEVTKDDFLNSAGVIAGSPVYFGIMAAELKKIFDEFVSTRRKMENKVGAAFATGGHHTGGKETTMMSIIQCMMIYGMMAALVTGTVVRICELVTGMGSHPKSGATSKPPAGKNRKRAA